MNVQKIPLKVSVGIPAYNEASTIAAVLKSILKQKQEGWELKEILVYDDGSRDKTLKKIAEIKDERIKVFSDGMRQGKTTRLRQMFGEFGGDVLCMVDADLRLDGDSVITHLISSFTNQKIMLVGGNVTPEAPETFIQRCIYSTFDVFYQSRLHINKGDNIFACGGIFAIRHHLADKTHFPEIFNEDAYLYLNCKKLGYKFKYQDKARGFYRLPRTLSDYLRQAFRSHPEAVEIELGKYFGDLVDKELSRPKLFYIRTVLNTFAMKPIEVICMTLIHLAIKPLYGIISSRYKLSWFTAASAH